MVNHSGHFPEVGDHRGWFGGLGGGVMGDAGVFGGIADPKQQLQVTEPYNRNCTKPWGNGKENRCRF